jgi:hypothetical protein
MATSIETIIDSFIAEHELDPELKEDIQNLTMGCIEVMFKHLYNIPLPVSTSTGNTGDKAKKVLKAEKVEDPSSVESIEELRNCTTSVLNQYCRDQNLKIGGNKRELMDRVWRHIQGESSDDDKSSRGKPKKEKKVAEKHVCSGFKTDGTPCQISGTEEYENCFFCYKHITDASKFLEKKNSGASSSGSSSKPKKSKKQEPVEELEDDEDIPTPPPSRKNKSKTPAPKQKEPVEELESEEE